MHIRKPKPSVTPSSPKTEHTPSPDKATASNAQMQELLANQPSSQTSEWADLVAEEVTQAKSPTPGEHTFPWGGGVYVHSDGEVLYMPPSNAAGDVLEKSGFSWYGESGYLALPKDSGGGLIAGTYDLPNGGALVVWNGEIWVDLPSYDHESSMLDAGYHWEGETGYMGLP